MHTFTNIWIYIFSIRLWGNSKFKPCSYHKLSSILWENGLLSSRPRRKNNNWSSNVLFFIMVPEWKYKEKLVWGVCNKGVYRGFFYDGTVILSSVLNVSFSSCPQTVWVFWFYCSSKKDLRLSQTDGLISLHVSPRYGWSLHLFC